MAFIDAALGDLKSLKSIASNVNPAPSESRSVYELKERIVYPVHRLRNLRTFILCVRKFDNDVHRRTDDDNNSGQEGSLGSLLVRIEEAVCRNAQQIHPYCLSLEAGLADHVRELIEDFTDDIESFRKEIEKWYVILTNCLQQSISPSTAADEVIAITASVLESLADVHSEIQYWYLETPVAMESLRENQLLEVELLFEKIKFLKNFIRFAMLQSVDHRQLEDMLNHVEDLAVHAAHFSFKCLYKYRAANDKEWLGEEMRFQISVLVQKIKPIDLLTNAIYTQALTSAKFSRQLHAPISDRDDDPLMIMKDFIYSLVTDLWEMLQLDTSPVVSLKDQLQVLHGGLRSLRTILVKQPNKLHEKIKDFVGVLICDAGLIFLSLYREDVKVDVDLVDLLERIKHVQKEVEDKELGASTSNFSRTNGLGFVDHLIEYLEDVATSEATGSNAQSCAQTVKEELVFLRSVLVKIVDLHNDLEELHALWNRILQVADRVESLIDLIVVTDLSILFRCYLTLS